MPIDPGTAQALEAALARVPGVLGAVALDDVNDAGPLEVQAFAREGADTDALRVALTRVAGDVTDRPIDVVVLEVAGAQGPTPTGGEASAAVAGGGSRPPLGGRPRLVSVVVDSAVADARHEAHVTLEGDELAAGRAVVGRDPLTAVVEAACDALARDGRDRPVPHAVDRVVVGGLDVMLVVVTIRGRPLVGSALLDEEPEPAAVVRATLDAVNRWYAAR